MSRRGLAVACCLLAIACRKRSRPIDAAVPVAAVAPIDAAPAVDVIPTVPTDGGLGPDARRYRGMRKGLMGQDGLDDTKPPEDTVGFGYKIGWIAVSTDDTTAVAAELGGAGTPIGWRRGVLAAYDGEGTFVSPPVEGWTLIVASAVLEASLPELEAFIVELSRRHGEAQAFLTHRVFEYHGWALARAGTLIRSYVYDGAKRGNLRAFGAPLPEEDGLPTPYPPGAPFMTPTKTIYGGDPWPPEARHEGDVSELAGRLSVDPTQLGMGEESGRGLGVMLGRISLER